MGRKIDCRIVLAVNSPDATKSTGHDLYHLTAYPIASHPSKGGMKDDVRDANARVIAVAAPAASFYLQAEAGEQGQLHRREGPFNTKCVPGRLRSA